MAIQISSKIEQSFREPNIAAAYGPYATLAEAHAYLKQRRLNVIGMTVGIQPTGSNTITEYWYQGGTGENNLVEKNTGGGGYAPPAGGIPKSDLSSDVQTSLDKADAAAPQSNTYTIVEVNNIASGLTTSINAAKNEIIGGASAGYDTLGELEIAIKAEETRAKETEQIQRNNLEQERSDRLSLASAVGQNTINIGRLNTAINNIQGAVELLDGHAVVVVEELPTQATPPSVPDSNIIYRLVTIDGDDVSYEDYMYNENDLTHTPVKIATYSLPGLDEAATKDSEKLLTSGKVFDAIQNEAVLDISVKNAVGEEAMQYIDLAAALGTNGVNVPEDYRVGGLNVKFIKAVPASFYVSKTSATEAPSGYSLEAEPVSIDTGYYAENQLTAFSDREALPTAVNGSNVYYYGTSGSYIVWTITKTANDASHYEQYRLMSPTWSTVVSDWQGVDDTPIINSENLVKSDGVAKELSGLIDLLPADKESILTLDNLPWVDNTYITSFGKRKEISQTESQHYKSVYCLDISKFRKIIFKTIFTGANGYISLYDKDKTLLTTYRHNESTSSFTVDNSSGSYHYISFPNNFVQVEEVEVLALPKNFEYPTVKLLSPDVVRVDIPADNIVKKAYIRNDDEIVYSPNSNLLAIKDLDISQLGEVIITLATSATDSYNKLLLIDASGNITIETPSPVTRINNINKAYKYLSASAINCCVFSLSDTIQAAPYYDKINNSLSDLRDKTTIPTKVVEALDISSYIMEDVSINANGAITTVKETSSYKYNSVVFFPINDYSSFKVSGTSGNAKLALFDENFELIETRIGTNIEVDNTSKEIYYISFAANVKTNPLKVWAETDGYVSTALEDVMEQCDQIEEVITFDDEYKFVDFDDFTWVSRTYINAANEQRNTIDGATFHYESARNIDIHGTKAVLVNMTMGTSAKIVTLDSEQNILNVYGSGEHIIDNTNDEIYYISICNNFIANPNPIFQVTAPATIKDVIEAIKNKPVVSNPLKGKTIAILGDSIMQNMSSETSGNEVTYVGTNGVTYQLSDLTNIGGLLYVTSTLVSGEVIAGTTIKVDIHNSKQSEYDFESWLALKNALEADSVINTGRGGARIKGSTITTAYPAALQPTFNTMPNHCLELKRRVDNGAPTPDLIMIWAGTNDVAGFIDNNQWVEPTNFDDIMALDYETELLSDTDAAMEHKRTFYGALRFCLEFLYRNFPNAVVVFFSPIPSVYGSRTYERERNVGSYIKKMAERYCALFVDACIEMGITDIFDTESNHKWLKDGLHPNAAGKKLYCNYTANKLKQVYFSKV